MRFFSLFNVVLLMLLCSVVILISPSHLLALVNIPGLVVVLGGTLCAVMLSKSQHKTVQLLKDIPSIVKTEQTLYVHFDFKQLLRFAYLFRAGQIKLLEQELKAAKQPILKKGTQLVMDRYEIEDVQQILNKERAKLISSDVEKAQVLRLMASYAPAFGMLGTLLGMIHMLYGLGDAGLNEIGTTMGFALLTTLYGLLLANVVCKPIAIKLERQVAKYNSHMNTLTEGLIMMREKKHPLVIKDMLEANGLPAESYEPQRKTSNKLFAKLIATSHVD
ncbi:MAG: biopolymer transporter ExbB [Piscirickettsiaceae bacterium]|nr:MAG: biopolymer transporter ExbB [Piscirickettsiaceae bacterium]